VALLASLKTCITTATIHKFCRQRPPKGALNSPEKRAAWERKYEFFSGMALHRWEKACECLRAAYNRKPDAQWWQGKVEKVAAAFAIHLNQPHGIGQLPQGKLDTTILKDDISNDVDGLHRAFWQVVLQAWFGTKARGLFSQSEGEEDGRPIQLLPSNFETTIGSKLVNLPEELGADSINPTSRIQEVDD
jgi:hypothetical protein